MTANALQPLPCPFCGSLPTIVPADPAIEGDAWAAVQCVNRRCVTYGYDGGVVVRDGALMCDERGPAAYKRLAIRRWNRRQFPRRTR